MTRIDYADTAGTQEPQFAIGGFCNICVVAAREPATLDSVRTVKQCRLYRLLWIGGPGVQVRPADAHQTASRVKPDRISVIFHHPVNHVAWQSVPARERLNAAGFDAAQSAISCGPERTARIRVEAANHSLSQPFGGCVRGADLTVVEMSHATVTKAKPYTTLPSIMDGSSSRFSATELQAQGMRSTRPASSKWNRPS